MRYETSCKFDAGPPTKARYDNVFENLSYTIDDISSDPNNPFVLKGERTIPGSKPGEGITVTWDLARYQ